MRSETLHDAMETVLRDHGGALPSWKIADEIVHRDLWKRPSDGLYPRATQISARANRYPMTFGRRGDNIVLADH